MIRILLLAIGLAGCERVESTNGIIHRPSAGCPAECMGFTVDFNGTMSPADPMDEREHRTYRVYAWANGTTNSDRVDPY